MKCLNKNKNWHVKSRSSSFSLEVETYGAHTCAPSFLVKHHKELLFLHFFSFFCDEKGKETQAKKRKTRDRNERVIRNYVSEPSFYCSQKLTHYKRSRVAKSVSGSHLFAGEFSQKLKTKTHLNKPLISLKVLIYFRDIVVRGYYNEPNFKVR